MIHAPSEYSRLTEGDSCFPILLAISIFLLIHRQCGGGYRRRGVGRANDAKFNLKMYTPPPWSIFAIVGVYVCIALWGSLSVLHGLYIGEGIIMAKDIIKESLTGWLTRLIMSL